MEQNAPGDTLSTTNVFPRIRKQTLQIAEHCRQFDDILDSVTWLRACRLLAPSESGLTLGVTRNEKFTYLRARTFRLCRWAAVFSLLPNARQALQPAGARCQNCLFSTRPLCLDEANSRIQRARAEREAHLPWYHAFLCRQSLDLLQVWAITTARLLRFTHTWPATAITPKPTWGTCCSWPSSARDRCNT